jgi:hypothetical protein
LTATTLVLLSLASCDREPPVADTPVVHTDPARLRTHVDLPPSRGGERWVVVPRGGVSAAPGPTDTALYACLTFDAEGWTRLASRTKPGMSGSVRVPESVARQLFDAAYLATAPLDHGEASFAGAVVDLVGLTKMPYRGTAVRSGDRLIVQLWTM